jgi:hypothetical protein
LLPFLDVLIWVILRASLGGFAVDNDAKYAVLLNGRETEVSPVVFAYFNQHGAILIPITVIWLPVYVWCGNAIRRRRGWEPLKWW